MAEFDKKNEELVQKLALQEKANQELKERLEHQENLTVMGGGANQSSGMSNMPIKVNGKWDGKTYYPLKTANAFSVFNAVSRTYNGNKYYQNWAEKNAMAVNEYFEDVKGKVDAFQEFPAEIKGFKQFLMQVKTTPDVMRTDISEFGAVLTGFEWSNELLRNVIEMTPARKYSMIKQVGAKTFFQPIRQGIPTATRDGETQAVTDSQSNYAQLQITPKRLNNAVQVTWDLLNDSMYNIAEEMITDNSLAFSQAEGMEFIRGDGVKQFFGIYNDPNVPLYTNTIAPYTNSTTSQYVPVSWQDIVLMTGQLKTGYMPMFAFNRRTLAYLRTLTDNNGRPVWLGPFGNLSDGPATLNGYAYSPEFIDTDDVTVPNGKPIIFADFPKFYQITDLTDMVMIRDEYTLKKQAIVEFMLMRWNTGTVIMKEAGLVMVRNG